MRRTLRIIVLFALSASTLSILPPLIIGMDKCITDQDVGKDSGLELQSDPHSLLRELKTRCYAACLLTARNILNSDGTLNLAHMIDITPIGTYNREHLIEVYKACANEAGADSCETAYKTMVCIDTKELA